MSWQHVVLWVVFALCVEGCVIAWRITDSVLDEQTRRRIDAEERVGWLEDELARMSSANHALAWQVRSAGLRPVAEIKPAEDVHAEDVEPAERRTEAGE